MGFINERACLRAVKTRISFLSWFALFTWGGRKKLSWKIVSCFFQFHSLEKFLTCSTLKKKKMRNKRKERKRGEEMEWTSSWFFKIICVVQILRYVFCLFMCEWYFLLQFRFDSARMPYLSRIIANEKKRLFLGRGFYVRDVVSQCLFQSSQLAW